MRGIQRTPADAAFSDCVRERANWTCERCEKVYPEGAKRAGLHCSHHFGRRHKSVRFDPDNAASLCFSCHNEVGENPLLHVQWFRERLGLQRYMRLQTNKQRIVRKAEYDLKSIAKHYREQLKEMRKRRENGDMGWLEFESWI